MVAHVDNWVDADGDLPLNSTPFAAEAAVILTAPPPPLEENAPPGQGKSGSERAPAPGTSSPPAMRSAPPGPSSAPPGSPFETDDAFPAQGAKWRWLASVAFIVAAGVAGYLAFR
jgi:hypothetical protein